MATYYDMSINCATGNDELETRDSSKDSYRTTDKAMDDAKTGARIFVHTGTYSGFDIETETTNAFEYNIYGTGKTTSFNSITHKGIINCIYKDVSIRDVNYSCYDTESVFDTVVFIGGHKFICKGCPCLNDSPCNEIEFRNCTFGINFQIFVVSGMYKFTFKNCTFKNKSFPTIYVDNGDVEINVTYSNFNIPIVENHRGSVYIYHTSCIFKDRVWSGKECSCFSVDEQQMASGLRSQKSYYDEVVKPAVVKSVPSSDDIFRGIEIDSDEFQYLELRPETAFVYVVGATPLTIVLPDYESVLNSHYIQILNNSSIVIIDGLQYSDRVINIRYLLGRGWIFFKG